MGRVRPIDPNHMTKIGDLYVGLMSNEEDTCVIETLEDVTLWVMLMPDLLNFVLSLMKNCLGT